MKLHLNLTRPAFTTETDSPSATIGTLVCGSLRLFTLEDRDRGMENGGVKVARETAIPRGTYKVILDYSNRFKREMPHILGVPGFTGVRIHAGNTSEDTEGCILVGTSRSADSILYSRAAFTILMDTLEEARLNDLDVELEIA